MPEVLTDNTAPNIGTARERGHVGDEDLANIGDVFATGLADRGQQEMVPVAKLVYAGSPRLEGEDVEHTKQLAEVDGALPPIIVHRPSFQIIDGVHRVCAAIAQGRTEIQAVFFDGSPESAFVIAVANNVNHGLPLSMADRRAAVARILKTHRHWSDRAIATVAGVSAKTVRAIRCATAEDPPLNARVGRDGRVRPLDATAGRRAAAEYLRTHSDTSLRAVAKAVGIAPGTARDVRERLQRGEDPVLARRDRGMTTSRRRKQSTPAAAQPDGPSDVSPLLKVLADDPALRMTTPGRELLRWLHLHAVNTVDSAQIVEVMPGHCVSHLVELAMRCSSNWAWIAHDLTARTASLRSTRSG